MTNGQLLKKARKQANLSQKELAEKLNVSASMIGQYENDLRNPKFETLKKIATALNVDPFSLMDFDTTSDYLCDRINNRAKYLLESFDQLNDEGQCKAVERVEELTEIPKYQKEKAPSEGE